MERKKAGIYTRTGDEGTTGLFGGSRIEKDSRRVEAYGMIDELCAIVAIVKTTEVNQWIFEALTKIQVFCHAINAEIASDEKGKNQLKKLITKEDVNYLEVLIDEFDEKLPKLDHFIVPVSKPSAAFLNLARTVCRRAERRLWALSREYEVNPNILKFVNRLSDLLFTFMRFEGMDGTI